MKRKRLTLITTIAATLGIGSLALAAAPTGKQTFKPLPVSLVDADGDGMLSATELQAAFKELRKHRKANHQAKKAKALAAHDANGNGTLEQSERDAMRAARFAKHDANGDGAISVKEAEGTRLAKRFTKLDSDGNGSITQAELAAHKKARGKRGKRGERGQRGQRGQRGERGQRGAQ